MYAHEKTPRYAFCADRVPTAHCLSECCAKSSETRFVEQLRQAFMTACQFFDEKQYARAVLMFTQLRGRYPQLQDYVQFFLADSYRNAERPEDAL